MDPAQLRNKIEWEGGVLNALDYGITDEDIDDEDLSEMWYNLQRQFENLTADISEFEDELNNRILDEQID